MYSRGGFALGYGPGWLRDESYGYNHGYTDATIPIGNLVFDMYSRGFKRADLRWRCGQKVAAPEQGGH